jgi:hypothetical protein
MDEMTADNLHPAMTRFRDGSSWRTGTDADVAWIRDETSVTSEITVAVPPIFDAHVTVDLVDHGVRTSSSAMSGL